MTAVAKGFAARGVDVVTFDFPYMRERRKVPDRAPVLEKAFLEVVAAARQWSSARRFFIGGKSMGGRMATHLGAAHSRASAGSSCLAIRCTRLGNPISCASQHLPSITAPVLIVQGERDTFGTPHELKPALDSMTAPVDLHVVQGGRSLAGSDGPRP